jgi:hypothetical protein
MSDAAMSNAGHRRFMVLPGSIEGDAQQPPSPAEALHQVLSSQPLAPSLLSEARHRQVVAKNSATASERATRLARDAELVYEQARRLSDPRSHRSVGLPYAAWIAGVLLTVSAAIAVALWWTPGWYFVLPGNGPVWLLLAHAAILVGELAIAITTTAVLLRRAESWNCWRLRKAKDRAAARRDEAAAVALSDDAAAVTATGAWESLVMEECRLAHPAAAARDDWVAACIDAARRTATPQE